jgi:hypothetical protein
MLVRLATLPGQARPRSVSIRYHVMAFERAS